MKLKIILLTLSIVLSLRSFSQEKIIRIGPGPQARKPEPVFIFDGIKIPSSITNEIFAVGNNEVIDSVSILPDSIFDCNSKLTNIGIAKIYTKDSVNLGAKEILRLTDSLLYKYPHTKLIINNTIVDWDENTYRRLIKLKPEDIIRAKTKENELTKCDRILELSIKE